MNKNVPNILTMARIFCTPIIIILFLLPIPYGIGKFVALGIYIIGCFTDFIDGYIARKYGLVSDFGKFMDQIADKFITTTAMILVLFAGITNTWASILLLLVVVLRDILVSGIRMVAANKNVVIAADIYGKIKSFFLDLGNMVLMLYIALRVVLPQENVFLIVVNKFGLTVLIVGVVLTLISCVNYGCNAFHALSQKKLENAENNQKIEENNSITQKDAEIQETKVESETDEKQSAKDKKVTKKSNERGK